MKQWKVSYAFRDKDNAYMEDSEFFESETILGALDQAERYLEGVQWACEFKKIVITDIGLMGNPEVPVC